MFGAALVAAWWLGGIFDLGAGFVHGVLLAAAVLGVAFLPWRRLKGDRI